MQPRTKWNGLAQAIAKADIGQVGLVEINTKERMYSLFGTVPSITLDDGRQGSHTISRRLERTREQCVHLETPTASIAPYKLVKSSVTINA